MSFFTCEEIREWIEGERGSDGTEMANTTHIYPEKSKAYQDLVHIYVQRENSLLYLSCCVQDV